LAGLPKSYIKKYGISKKAWAEYRKSKGKRSRSASTGGRKTASRRRRYYRKAKSRARSSAGPLLGFATFAGGAYAGEWLTETKLRPWLDKSMPQGGLMGKGALLLGLAYATRKFTSRKRGISNAGQGAAGYMAAKGTGMLIQALKAGNGLGGLFGG